MSRLAADAPIGARQLVLDAAIDQTGAVAILVGDRRLEICPQPWSDTYVRLVDPLAVELTAGTAVHLVSGS